MTLSKIPLFPLSITALPGETVPLHIYEERYKAMVEECIENGLGQLAKPFGLTLAAHDGLAVYGCTLRVEQITAKYEDGSLDLVARAEQRFRIDEILDERPYFEANIELLYESPGVDGALRKKVIELHQTISLLSNTPYTLADKAEILSFPSALGLGLDHLLKQNLLSLKSEDDRLLWLSDLYLEVVAQLQKTPTKKKSTSRRKTLTGTQGLDLMH